MRSNNFGGNLKKKFHYISGCSLKIRACAKILNSWEGPLEKFTFKALDVFLQKNAQLWLWRFLKNQPTFLQKIHNNVSEGPLKPKRLCLPRPFKILRSYKKSAATTLVVFSNKKTANISPHVLWKIRVYSSEWPA